MRAAVIPIKRLCHSKTRLKSQLTPAQRELLVLKVLGHMLGVLADCPQIHRTFVITPDPRVVRFVLTHSPGTGVILDQHSPDLNASAAHAARLLEEKGYGSMLFLLGDLPLLGARDIALAVRASAGRPVVIMPDRHLTGTNALLLSPPRLLEPRFGPDSFRRHREGARDTGICPVLLQTPGFLHDLDTPEDLLQVLRSGCRPRHCSGKGGR